MCVAMAPARFTGTTVYAGEARRNGQVVHVAGYENTVQSLAGRPRGLTRLLRGARAQGNAMMLHFPAVPGTMTQANAVATDDCPRLLEDMVRALAPPVAAADTALAQPAAAPPVEVFEHGIYTVVLAGDARSIPAALGRVPRARRPRLNPALFDWYHATFPGWPVALCCFDTTDAARATPMLWWYEPAYPQWLFAPGVDSHTGGVPDLAAEVAVDHWVVFGTAAGAPVRYRDPLSDELAALVPYRVAGVRLQQRMRNADFVIAVDAARAGEPSVERRLLRAA